MLRELWTRNIPPVWRDSLLAFLGGRVFYSLVGVFAWWTKVRPLGIERYYYEMTPLVDGLGGALLGVWQRWDSLHYQRIAAYGYFTDQVSAFYPLYPLLARALTRLTGWHELTTLMLVSNLAFFFSLALLHRLVSERYSLGIARRALASAALFPTGFYFYALYPQSLLLLLTLLAALMARRGRWAAAGAAAFLAGLTHTTAVFLAFLLGIEALIFLRPAYQELRARALRWRWEYLFAGLAPLAAPAGMAAFQGWRRWAGFPPFAELLGGEWQRVLSFPWQGLAAITRFALALPPQMEHVADWANLLTFLLVILLSAWGLRRVPWPWWIAQVGFLLFVLSSLTTQNPLLSFARYILGTFPLFVELALLARGKAAALAWFGLSLLAAFVFSALFFLWQAVM